MYFNLKKQENVEYGKKYVSLYYFFKSFFQTTHLHLHDSNALLSLLSFLCYFYVYFFFICMFIYILFQNSTHLNIQSSFELKKKNPFVSQDLK